MIRYIYFILLFLLPITPNPILEAQSLTNSIDEDAGLADSARAMNPHFYCTRYGDDWEVFLQFTPSTHFERYTWMLTANPFGAQLQVVLTNGVQCQPTNPKVLEAFNLPFFTTVSNALNGTDPSRRGYQWPRANSSFQSAGFRLKAAFDMPFTNDVLLQLTPLLYKENTNNKTVRLVRFAPFRAKLKADGTVEKFE